MPLKDHYKTLGLPAGATLQDIKKAYRALAHKYHPDKNQDNPYAAAHFRDIRDAYAVLSDEKQRKLYDEERYFAGLSARKDPVGITGGWILEEAKKLSAHMARTDSYRMNHGSLHDYVLLLLSDAHIAVLQQEHREETNREIVKEILYSIRNIHYKYYPALVQRLGILAESDRELRHILFVTLRQRKRQAVVEKFLPLIVIAITLLLCLIMYLYSRK